jgi:hypothetical protein
MSRRVQFSVRALLIATTVFREALLAPICTKVGRADRKESSPRRPRQRARTGNSAGRRWTQRRRLGGNWVGYAIQSRGGQAAKGRCRLVIAPIGHGNMTELKYPANAGNLPQCANNLAWFDAMLKGKQNGIAAEKPVNYYVMGDPTDDKAPGNVWRAADTWPPPAAETPRYLTHRRSFCLFVAIRRRPARSVAAAWPLR